MPDGLIPKSRRSWVLDWFRLNAATYLPRNTLRESVVHNSRSVSALRLPGRHAGRELRSLRLVDRVGLGVRDCVQFAVS